MQETEKPEQQKPDKQRRPSLFRKGIHQNKSWSVHKEERNPSRTEKNRDTVVRKNTCLRISRIVLWGMLLFFFGKGVVYTFRPDTVTQAQILINEFEQELEDKKTLDTEVAAFAQNFAQEYLTYTAREDSEYQERLKKYMGNNNTLASLELANGSAKAVYVEAYRMEPYAEKQWDVYVLAQVEYTTTQISEESSYEVVTQTEQTCLKVPVYVDAGNMIIEDLPLFVHDNQLAEEYHKQDYVGTSLEETDQKEITTSVTNFLTAYYEQDKTVIEYYLSQNADKERFLGLNGRYQLEQVKRLNCYQEPDQPSIICIVELKISDPINGAKLNQRLHLKLLQADGRYYIESMDTRTGNLAF